MKGDWFLIISRFGCRRYHKKFNKFKRTVRRSSSRSSGGGIRKYSRHWWYWTHEGRKTWRHCKKKGKESKYWKRHHCGRHKHASKGSKWWWWSSKGRKMWKRCQAKGKGSKFWKKHHCGAGR